jgi:hypothetical protein
MVVRQASPMINERRGVKENSMTTGNILDKQHEIILRI